MRYLSCFKHLVFYQAININAYDNTGRIGVPDEYINKPWEIDTLPLVYIIPSLSGPGVCTNALLEGLVHAHNAFIDHCQLLLKEKLKKKLR